MCPMDKYLATFVCPHYMYKLEKMYIHFGISFMWLSHLRQNIRQDGNYCWFDSESTIILTETTYSQYKTVFVELSMTITPYYHSLVRSFHS